ncbi:MAG: hypothetical protein AB7V25_17170 [Mangrovibacterium sp.]
MEDGIILNTEKAVDHWEEDTRWNGNNHISIATGSQWEHETLYKSAKGRYWLEHTSQWQGSTPYASILEPAEAAAWLLNNGKDDLPEDLEQYRNEVEE